MLKLAKSRPRRDLSWSNYFIRARRFAQYYKPRKILLFFIIDVFFALLLSLMNVIVPFLISVVIYPAMEASAAQNDMEYAIMLPVLVLSGVVIIRIICNWIMTYYGHVMGVFIEIEMREKEVDKMHRLPMQYYDQTTIGSFISKQITGLKDVPEYAHHVPEDLIIAFCTIIGALAFCFFLGWQIGIIISVIIGIGILLVWLARRKWHKITILVREANSKTSSTIVRQVESISEIKSFSTSKTELKVLKGVHKNHLLASRKFYRAEGRMTLSTVLTSGFVFMLTQATTLIANLQGQSNTGGTLALSAIGFFIIEPITRLSSAFTQIVRGGNAINEHFKFIDLPEEKNEGKIKEFKLQGKIEFKNVSFSYKSSKNENLQVIKNFNLTINPGEHIAIIGKSGVGKSTILKLLLRLYEADEGEILLDGNNIKSYELVELRRQIGFVQQTPIIFNDTLYNNIAYGAKKFDEKAFKRAAEVSQIDELANRIPDKYQSMIGASGTTLSGGQKQRIAIARVLLNAPEILMLDEMTSAQDGKTEQEIESAIKKIDRQKTMLVVAHNLATIKEADKVIVLGPLGKVLETGSYETLHKNKRSYLNQLEKN